MEIRSTSSTHARAAARASADAELPLPVARTTDLSGRVLGSRYSLRRRIGGGSMGTVYEARDMTLGTAVAVTDLGETDDGLFYSVMEFLEGESLDALLSSSRGPLPWRRVVTITVQVCAALQAAHERGVIHRDIKPGNCFLVHSERDGVIHVKVLDLGLARLMPAGGRPTPPGRLGAPEYLAPEQVQGFTCDHRVDLYAVGVMMYQLLTRRLPFTADSAAAIMKMHIEAAPEPLRRAAPHANIPAGLEAVVLRALAKRPDDRFPDANAFADAIRAAAAEAEAEAIAIDEAAIEDEADAEVAKPNTGRPVRSIPARAIAPSQAPRRRVGRLGLLGLLGLLVALASILAVALTAAAASLQTRTAPDTSPRH